MKLKEKRPLMTSIAGSTNWLKVLVLSGLVLLLSTSVEARSYRSVLKEWTRHKEWYNLNDMKVELLWHATHYSQAFRRAQAEEVAKRKYLDAVAGARYLADQEKRQEEGDEFFVGLYTRKPYKEFSLGKESFWETVLVNENGEEFKPVRIDFVEVTPLEKILFPYLGRWSSGYRVVFPKANLGKSFELVLRSVLGETHLQWK